MTISALATLAICIEAIITAIKEATTGGIKWQMIASWVIGIVICIAYNADMLATQGLISSVPFIGCVITGIAMGRGSNYFFDFFKSVRGE